MVIVKAGALFRTWFTPHSSERTEEKAVPLMAFDGHNRMTKYLVHFLAFDGHNRMTKYLVHFLFPNLMRTVTGT